MRPRTARADRACCTVKGASYLTAHPAYPGDHFTISGRGCPSGDTVYLMSTLFRNHTFGKVGTVTTTARKGNLFSARVRIPAGTKTGVYTIGVRCGGGNLGLTVKLRVS